jgi:hypothetical protein
VYWLQEENYFLLQEQLALAVKSCLNLTPQQNTHHTNDISETHFTLDCIPGFWILASPKPSSVHDSGLILTSNRMQSYTYLTSAASHCRKSNKHDLAGEMSCQKVCSSFNLVKDRHKSINNNNIKRCNYIF